MLQGRGHDTTVGASSQCYGNATRDFMIKVSKATCALRDIYKVSITRVYTQSTFIWNQLYKCELMLLKCQINTNTNKNGFLLHTKWRGIEILILSFNYSIFFIYVCRFLKLGLWVLQPYKIISLWSNQE